MKKYLFLLVCAFLLNGVSTFAQVGDGNASPDKIWQSIDDSTLQRKSAERSIIPNSYRTFALNKIALQNLLDSASTEFANSARAENVIMTLPMPDGTFARFEIEESPIMEPELAAKYPEIKTYRGQGIDDPTATARFDLMPSGFHSMILSASGTILIDPYAKGDADNYISYFKQDASEGAGFVCHLGKTTKIDFYKLDDDFLPILSGPTVVSGANLRTYRLALAATGEYTAATGGTVAKALAAQVLIMNRVNGVYERDLAIRMVLVANNDSVIYINSATDPYTNDNGSTMLGQNRTNLNAVIGSTNYDIGHVFSTGGGGIAGLRVPCSTNKAQGVTGLSNPVGDAFAIDYVAHEIGHQFGGNHTFNADDSNRSSTAAYEPGSGVTIMSYAGIVSGQNLAGHSIDTFHVKSLEEIIAFKENITTGGSCGAGSTTGNSAPTVNAPALFTIPKLTPFALTATATDANNDSITYDWQEYDLGSRTSAVPNTDSDNVPRPIFRPYLPTTSGTRFFPSLIYILNNKNVPPNLTGGFLTGELLPSITRTMTFQVVARDNRANGGGINTATTRVAVDGNSGPFVVTFPNTNVSWLGNTAQTVTWNVANTTGAPVSAANVKISLSTDGGNTFPTVLAASTANDGSEVFTLPNTATSSARLKVEAVGNVFFDISDTNFSITNSSTAINYEADVSPRGAGDGAVSSTDVSIIQGFQLGLGLPYQSNEFQRADCAPFETRGDGQISSIDVSQAQAYQLGLNNAPQPTAGPSNRPAGAENGFEFETPLSVGKANQTFKQSGSTSPREVRVAATSGSAGQTVTIPVEVDALGDESVYGFSLSYDADKLSNPLVTTGNAGGSVLSNSREAGRIGVSVNFGGGTIEAGANKVLINVRFTIAANASGTIGVNLTDALTFREVASGAQTAGGVKALPTNFTDGNLNVNSQIGRSISGRVITSEGRGIKNVAVSIRDANGNSRTTITTSFGYYRFDGAAAGSSYVITASGKRFAFRQPSQTVNLNEDATDVNFIGTLASSLRDAQ